MLQLWGSAARAAKTWMLPGAWILLSVHLVLWYQTSSGKPLVHHNGGARSVLRIWIVIFMVNYRPSAVEWHVHDKCLKGATVVYSLNWLHCHVATGGIFGSLLTGDKEESIAPRIPPLHCKAAMKERVSGPPPTWSSIVDCCVRMLPETIVAEFEIFEWNGNQRFSTVHARPGVAYVYTTH